MKTATADLVARLQQQEAAVSVARKAFNDDTARAQAAFHDTAQKLGLCISSVWLNSNAMRSVRISPNTSWNTSCSSGLSDQ